MLARIKVNEKAFIETIQQGISDHLKSKIKGIGVPTRKRVGEVIKRELLGSPTVKDLISGQLKHDFGLTDSRASAAIDSIISYMSDNIEIKTKTSPKETIVLLSLLPIDPEFISSIVGGEYSSYNNGVRHEVKWADWLITHGTEIVISDYGIFDASSEGRRGRSGGTFLMKKGIGSFRVNPEHSGTEEDNFITRAITPHAKEILEIVLDEIGRS